MNLRERPLRSFWLLLTSFLACFAGPLAAAGLPEFENEFFNDFSGSVSNSQKIEISRNLRLASETSQIHAMVVVIKKVADYPSLPQEVHAMALQLARERKVGSQKTRQGLLALFALEDHKFSVAHSTNLSPKLADSIRDTFNSRVRAKLRDGQTGQALVFASEDLASLLPKEGAGSKPGAPGTHAPGNAVNRHASTASPDAARPEAQKETGLGWGVWIAIILGGYLLVSLLGRLFSGGGGLGGGGLGGGGFGGGGAPGWGGLLGGLLGGGLLGYWLGGSSSNASESHHDASGTGSNSGLAGDPAPDGGADSSESGGFDSFGGGDFGGDNSGDGGSDGDW
jgi:uncharacterized membrane protein YgcG